jgi:acyl-CoA reductase-like NAD-dependent aldehyde dehydrogenase
MISIAESCLADVSLKDTDKPGYKRYIKRTPLGVVLVIAPWKLVSVPPERNACIHANGSVS